MEISKTSPQFFAGGYTNKHDTQLVGIVLTKNYLIICNSGEGTEFHSIRQSSQLNETHFQPIIFLDRPDDWQLFNFLKQLIIFIKVVIFSSFKQNLE